jgi:hypothetical protein
MVNKVLRSGSGPPAAQPTSNPPIRWIAFLMFSVELA